MPNCIDTSCCMNNHIDAMVNRLTHYCLTGPFVTRIVKISLLKKVVIIEKISYERIDYESVDEKSLSKAMCLKTTKKK